MRKVTDIVKDLLKDTTVREKKPFTVEEPVVTAQPRRDRDQVAAAKEEAKPKQHKRPLQHNPPPREGLRERMEQYNRAPLQSEQVARGVQGKTELDPNCSHKWSVTSGVKSCWLCGGLFVDEEVDPRSRRDRSTSWQAQVYGKKKK